MWGGCAIGCCQFLISMIFDCKGDGVTSITNNRLAYCLIIYEEWWGGVSVWGFEYWSSMLAKWRFTTRLLYSQALYIILFFRLYNPTILKSISKHCETEEQLNNQQISDILTLRRHMAGYDICKELFISDYDMQLHSR